MRITRDLRRSRGRPLAPQRIDTALLLRFMTEGVTRGGAVITLPLLTHFLGIDGYGRYSLAQATILALVPVLSLGVGFSLVRQIAGLRDGRDIPRKIGNAISLVTLAAAPVAVAIWIFAPFLSTWVVGAPTATDIIKMSAMLMVASVWQGISHEGLRARQHALLVSVLNILEAISLPLGIVFLIYIDSLSAARVVMLFALIKLITAVVGLSFLVRGTHIFNKSHWALSVDEVRALLALGLPFMIAGFGEWLMGMGDRLVIGGVAGAGVAGIYVASQILTSVLSSWGAPFWWVLFPRLCAAFEAHGNLQAHEQAQKISGLFLQTALPVAAILIVVGPEVLHLLLGEDVGIERTFLILLISAVFINQFTTPWEYIVYIEKRGKFLMQTTLLWGAVAIALNFILLPVLGLTGAALAAVCGRLGFGVQVFMASAKMGHGLALAPGRHQFVVVGALLTLSLGVMVIVSRIVPHYFNEALFQDVFLATVFMVSFLLSFIVSRKLALI